MICKRFILASLLTMCAAFLPGFSSVAASQENVTLGWDPSSSQTIAGYRIYVGGSSLSYTNSVSVGKVVSGTVSNLVAGKTYYFAVTAFDVVGLESPYSGQITYTIPPLTNTGARLTSKRLSATQFQVSGTAPAGYIYSVYASKDLKTWTLNGSVTASGTGSLSYTDSKATNKACYYRLLQTSP